MAEQNPPPPPGGLFSIELNLNNRGPGTWGTSVEQSRYSRGAVASKPSNRNRRRVQHMCAHMCGKCMPTSTHLSLSSSFPLAFCALHTGPSTHSPKRAVVSEHDRADGRSAVVNALGFAETTLCTAMHVVHCPLSELRLRCWSGKQPCGRLLRHRSPLSACKGVCFRYFALSLGCFAIEWQNKLHPSNPKQSTRALPRRTYKHTHMDRVQENAAPFKVRGRSKDCPPNRCVSLGSVHARFRTTRPFRRQCHCLAMYPFPFPALSVCVCVCGGKFLTRLTLGWRKAHAQGRARLLVVCARTARCSLERGVSLLAPLTVGNQCKCALQGGLWCGPASIRREGGWGQCWAG